eukprot:1138195-Pelagomonas_calceolata.AAC.4
MSRHTLSRSMDGRFIQPINTCKHVKGDQCPPYYYAKQYGTSKHALQLNTEQKSAPDGQQRKGTQVRPRNPRAWHVSSKLGMAGSEGPPWPVV